METIFSLLGIAFSYLIIKNRESLANIFGDAPWMRYVGGPFAFVVIIGILIFFWSITTLTGTDDIFLYPIIYVITFGQMGSTPPAPPPPSF